jgi:uncharacterized protein
METKKKDSTVAIEDKVVIRSDSEGNEYVEGYGVLFNEWSKPLETSNGIKFRERINRSAFDGADMNDVFGLVHHNWNKVIGRTKSGTLELRMDDKGVFYSAKLPKTTIGNDLKEEITRGDITGSSFSYNKDAKADYQRGADGMIERTVTKINYIRDIGPTPSPAFINTSAGYSIRSLTDYVNEDIEDNEGIGLPRNMKVKLEKYRANL